MKKRILLLLQLMMIGTSLYAQSQFLEYHKKPAFIASKYNGVCKNTVLKMQSYAIIQLNEPPMVLGGNADSSFFKVEVDPDSVYDCSYKIYSAQFSNCSINYTTYAFADKLSITYNDKEYSLSCIDGGMDVHIKNLTHKYKSLKNGEELHIYVTEDIPLTAKDRSEIVLQKGSYFFFSISGQ